MDFKEEPTQAKDSMVHCLVCPTWQYFDITDVRCIDNMVTYLRRVNKATEEKSDKERKRKKKEREDEEEEREIHKRKRGQ